MGLFATLSINDIQHNVFSVIMLSVVIVSVAITQMFGWVSLAECRGAMNTFRGTLAQLITDREIKLQ